MFNLMVNKERNVLLPSPYHKTAEPYEAVVIKMSEEFVHDLQNCSEGSDMLEFKLALMDHINSLVDLFEEM